MVRQAAEPVHAPAPGTVIRDVAHRCRGSTQPAAPAPVTRSPLVATFGAALLAITLMGCSTADDGRGAPAGAAPPRSGIDLARRPVASVRGATVRTTLIGRVSGIPTALTASPDGTELLVAQVTGEVRRISLGRERGYEVPTVAADPVLDLSGRTRFDGQNQGLLGLAFSHDGDRIVASYTAHDGAVTVESFPYKAGRAVDPASGTIVFATPHPLAGLSGGNITLDRAGDVLLGIGDMGLKYTVPPSAQDPKLLLGAVVRIPAARLSGGSNAGSGSEQIVAKGLRNPWGISVDPATGDVWIADVGEGRAEEFDRVAGPEAGVKVANFGWPYFEGTLPEVSNPPTGAVFTPPLRTRTHEFEVCGAVGGLVSHSALLPKLNGAYIYGDLCSASIRALTHRNATMTDDVSIGSIGETALAIGQGADGSIYVLGAKGGVYRLDPPSWRGGAVSTPPPTDAAIGGATTTSVAPGGPTSSTTTTTPLPEVCALVDTFIALDPLSTLPPDDARTKVATAVARASAAERATAGTLHDDVAVLRGTFEDLTRAGEATGWNARSPEMQRVLTDSVNGRSPYERFPKAINDIIEAQVGCGGSHL